MSNPRLTQRNEVFNQQVHSEIIQSKYDLSARAAGSYRMGILYPIYCRNDILPGDMFSMNCAPFIRFLPLVSPSLTNVDVEVRFFFVPRRLLWSQWKNFISPSTSDDVNLVEPYIYNWEALSVKSAVNIYNVAGSLYDHMGCASIPWLEQGGTNGVYGTRYDSVGNVWQDGFTGIACPVKRMTNAFPSTTFEPLKFSAYPFLAYNMIYNEYFRDENLQDEYLAHVTTGGNHHGYQFFLHRINWEKDYFTSALPFVTQSVFNTPTISAGDTIEELRETSALTKWLELQAIGGHRYQESILTHFGIRVPDEAAQIPVYLGGGKCPVQIGSVEQNSPATDSPLATLAGKATAGDSMFIDKVQFKEHGTVLGLMYIRPKALYADVTPRDMLAKDSRHDYYWPSFANLGDESISPNELSPGWFDLGSKDFGYQMRYASYRTSFDQVHGQLRPLESLETWTQARSWSDVSAGNYNNVSSAIQIESSFIRCNPSNRIFAIEKDNVINDNLVGEVITLVEAVRPMPNYVDPKID